MVTDYLGAPCSTLSAICKQTSPIAQVHPGAPYFFGGHGTADELVPFAQARAFVAELRAAHVDVRSFVAEGGPHTYWSKNRYSLQDLAAISSFLSFDLQAPRP
jgi:acetyl esterase/lipase